ncbi:hypothetical protein AB0N50_36250 [Streptomyces pharetrae]|uniref:hypothetical protein n=1 Tax=Streptomyces pharetrae TaxID=291370 RepID=UPI0034608FD4
MIVKPNQAKVVGGIAAAAMALGAFSASPAQAAATCNSNRVCFYQPDGNITNVDPGIVPQCGSQKYPGAIGNNYVRNRSTHFITLFYDYDQNGQVTLSETVAVLGWEEAVTLNPNSRYFYCQTIPH